MPPRKAGIGSKTTLLTWTGIFLFFVWGQWKHSNPERREKSRKYSRKQRERDDRRKDHKKGYTVTRDRDRTAPIIQ
ncbi:hypothetical protein CLAFUW4_03847 [Fulvia fulva]|uniref:Uncharacterized protein n=1 Tax=Passalora fulva TaxID=5499 RepID=A0A9Q8P5C9_PASFU|nr:uncharacterized protein CLAFUR5_03819 [Fulvia fulva]KAK4630893.1 hypothetical protein CLAFUR4_03835 [Fulvia fulva]KAK4633437.1 hypothetical protein CLAFUR0_03834 [Fulvia fulva]UJO13799.1 hypothetical protein CLAFUR5_03819 [Fulvia fulva]WPV11886.1 hypothetical protein CLAFUW4_03847 [Fulvia fulva]WPV26796.1 hypothetical protein CLAFUW7_03839 [Fulvia fulva]